MIPPALTRLLATCAGELERLDADWAIAGAAAMEVHGYARATRDVDLFVGDDAREALIEALADRGLEVEEVFPPVHYAISADRDDPDVRVELLFPALGVESLALMAARPARVGKRRWPVIPLDHLVAIKLVTDPIEDPERFGKDQQDLRELWLRGLVDGKRVASVLDGVADPGALERLKTLLAGGRP